MRDWARANRERRGLNFSLPFYLQSSLSTLNPFFCLCYYYYIPPFPLYPFPLDFFSISFLPPLYTPIVEILFLSGFILFPLFTFFHTSRKHDFLPCRGTESEKKEKENSLRKKAKSKRNWVQFLATFVARRNHASVFSPGRKTTTTNHLWLDGFLTISWLTWDVAFSLARAFVFCPTFKKRRVSAFPYTFSPTFLH